MTRKARNEIRKERLNDEEYRLYIPYAKIAEFQRSEEYRKMERMHGDISKASLYLMLPEIGVVRRHMHNYAKNELIADVTLRRSKDARAKA